MKTQITYDEGVREECIYEGNDSKSKNSKKKRLGNNVRWMLKMEIVNVGLQTETCQ